MLRSVAAALLVLVLAHGVLVPIASAATDLAPGTLLVATRELLDPNFSKTVVLLIDYDGDGAMGVIVNRGTPLKLSEMMPDVDVLEGRDDTIFLGGPVSPSELFMLVRSADEPEESLSVFDDVWVSQSLDLLERLAGETKSKARFRIYAGYAGWAPHQLDAEVGRGDWLVIPADGDIVFNDRPGRVWRTLAPAEDNPFVTLRAP